MKLFFFSFCLFICCACASYGQRVAITGGCLQFVRYEGRDSVQEFYPLKKCHLELQNRNRDIKLVFATGQNQRFIYVGPWNKLKRSGDLLSFVADFNSKS